MAPRRIRQASDPKGTPRHRPDRQPFERFSNQAIATSGLTSASARESDATLQGLKVGDQISEALRSKLLP